MSGVDVLHVIERAHLFVIDARGTSRLGPLAGDLHEAGKAVAELIAAAKDYMSQIGQGYEACGLPFGPAQQEADARIRAALKAVQP